MIKFSAILNTNGSGYWSDVAKPVQCTRIAISYCNDEMDFGELRVYFDTNSWDVYNDGLVYTDNQFLKELKEALTTASLDASDVTYSEQGMQGTNYVSLDVGKKFIDSMLLIAPEVFAC